MTVADIDETIEISCAILLAAGRGSRFAASSDAQTHKLLADLRGRPVYEWALEAVLAARPQQLIVVTGAAPLRLPSTVTEVHNPRWAEGQATSLHAGVAAAAQLGVPRVVVGLADQPFITADAWREVARAGIDAAIAVATYEGRRGNPVALDRSVWDLLPSEGDQGARSLFSLRPDLVREVACKGSSADIDTMEDLRQWNSSTNSP